MIDLVVDGREVRVEQGATLLDACRTLGIDTPTLCFLETLTPVNACRVCVVEVEGSRPLVAACSRRAEEGMVVETDSERVRHSRRLVLELLGSSVDLTHADARLGAWMERYGAEPGRFGTGAARVDEPLRSHDDLYVRDYDRCILCYKCVQACGDEAQHTFAISVSGRGFEARISTEFDIDLTASACVYCGNCIAVCPTGALVPTTEHDMRVDGTWDPGRQSTVRTVCPYCGVGCNLELHVQDDSIVKVTSPLDHDITHGNLCVKGRFGWQFVDTPEAP